MNKNTTTIIPIHPPKYPNGIKLLESFHLYVVSDIWFIFSNQTDYLLFRDLTTLDFNYLLLSEEYKSYGNIINAKKLFGVEEMFKLGYRYVGVFDSEVEFVKPFDTNTIYSDIFNSNKFKANYTNDASHIIKECAIAMKLDTNQRLIDLTKNFSVYWWFNDICVYEKNTFAEFIDWYKKHPNFTILRDDYLYFEYLIYSIWLICFKNFDVELLCSNMVFYIGAIETNQNDIVSNIFKSAADANKNHKEIEHIKVLIQIDKNK
jgi:hypothetical protein